MVNIFYGRFFKLKIVYNEYISIKTGISQETILGAFTIYLLHKWSAKNNTVNNL